MRRFVVVLGALVLCASVASAQPATGPYKIIKTAKVGGAGGFDYVHADAAGRRLYVPRSGTDAHISVFDLDTLAPTGEIPNVNAHGVVVDAKSGHGFASSHPVVMFDTKTLAVLKKIDVQGAPDGIMFDPFNERVWILSHSAPHATIIDARSGNIVGTMDLGGAPEQSASDGKGHVYIDIEDANLVAVVDAKTLKVTNKYDIAAQAKTPAGLALDAKHHILFSACRNTPTMVILNAKNGKLLQSLPIGTGVDGSGFNPTTQEAFSSQSDGTLTIIKENSPTSFVVEQTLQTLPGARTMSIDAKTNRVLLITAEFSPAPAGGRGGRGPMLPDTFTLIAVGR